MIGLISFVIFGIINHNVATKKGFKPLRWVFSPGIIGLIVLRQLPNALEDNISVEEYEKRVAHGNGIGQILCLSGIMLSVVLFVIKVTAGTL